MSRTQYYEQLKARAREVRAQFGFITPKVGRSDLRKIFKHHGIAFDLWPIKNERSPAKFKKLRGAFFCDELGAAIMVNRDLPNEPAIFTMAHEFKHFLFDRDVRSVLCSDNNQGEEIEIGAEIFAAELIFPDQDFRSCMAEMEVSMGHCTPETLVRLKRRYQATLSYASLVKKATFLEFAAHEVFVGVRWQKLEEDIFGEPIYRKIRRSKKNTKK